MRRGILNNIVIVGWQSGGWGLAGFGVREREPDREARAIIRMKAAWARGSERMGITDGRGAYRTGGGSPEGGSASQQVCLGRLSHVSECSGFEDKGRLKTQVTGGSAIGGEKAIRRGQWRKPDSIVEPN